MSAKYEKLMADVEEYLEGADAPQDVVEAALDAMSFVASLNQMFKENGAPVPDEPDMAVLENYMDGVHESWQPHAFSCRRSRSHRYPRSCELCPHSLRRMTWHSRILMGTQDLRYLWPFGKGSQGLQTD